MSEFSSVSEPSAEPGPVDELAHTVSDSGLPKDMKEGKETPPIHPAIAEDHQFIRDYVTDAAILTLTREYITVVIIRTPYARVQLRIQYLAKYPEEAPLVELSSPTLPQPLLRNKEKVCIDKAKENLGKPQAAIIYTIMHEFVHTNMFIPAWREIKLVMTMCEGKGQLAADEKEGVLQMRLCKGKYRQGIKLKVPYMYPEEGVEIEFTNSNYPEGVQYMFRSQADEIVRRCIAGHSPEQALNGSNPIKLEQMNTKKEPSVKLTSGNLKNLKHDVNVLKQMSDLRVATTAADKKNQYFTEGNAERREARKDLRKLARAEAAADEAQDRKEREAEQKEMKALMGLKVSETAQPSLLAAARFLLEDYASRLPIEKCQACKKPVFPEDPSSPAITEKGHDERPLRTYCGHWLHHSCLDEWLTTPPFVRQCPVCDRRIWHPDWPADHKILERQWQNKEARKREIADIDFMF